MALQRRLLVGLASASSLLLVYVLCLRLEAPLSVAPFRRLHALVSQSQSSTSFRFDSLDNVQSRINKESSALRLKETSEEAKEETRKGDEETRRGNEEAKVDMRGGDEETKEETRRGDEEMSQDRDIEAHRTAKDNSTENINTAKNITTTTATPVQARTTKPGTKPGSEPGLKPGSEPGLKPGSEPGLKPGLLPGLKPGPTEPPFIGDLYYSEERPPLTDCPRSIRRLVPHTDFKTRFRPDVPVLQWSKHLSPDQYQRLRQYPGAHGWGGVSYETLVDVMTSSLDTPQSGLLLDDLPLSSSSSSFSWSNSSLCVRCAVVGNGGILKDSKKGPEIDQHHYVFRTNGAIIQGFEEDVGSRTTHYIFSTNTLRNSLRSYKGVGYSAPPHTQETRYVFLPDHDRDYLLLKAAATHTRVQRGPERDMDPAQFFGSDVTKEKLKMYHPDFIRYIRNRFLRSNALKTKYKDLYRPSTGAVMLLSALHQCDQVSAYGFMTPDFSRFSDHYFDQKFHSVGFFINHDLRLEMLLWQQLHQQGLLRLYMGPETTPGPNRV